jgi:hypothetical protein
MKFLKQLETFFLRIFYKTEYLPDNVLAQEPISRFLFSKREFTESTARIGTGVFLPPKNSIHRSVYRTINCSEKKIWWLADKYVALTKPVLARANIIAKHITDVGLEIVPDFTPHPRHANITKWPQSRSAMKMKAVELTNRASLVVK